MPGSMSNRARRRSLIKQLIQDHRVSSQEELVRMLDEQGIECTQATLSRDLRDLNVVRKNTRQGPVYVLDRSKLYMQALRQVVGMEILNVQHNGALIVIRTLSGRAEGVAGFLDSWGNPDLLGTVAGDDTVFVAPADLNRIDELAQQIRRLEQEA